MFTFNGPLTYPGNEPPPIIPPWPGVPATTNQGGTGQVPQTTSPSPQPVQSTGLPTPNNVQNNPAQSTVLTSAGGLLSEVGAIVSNPSQHIFGVIVLLAIAWFIWKHR